MLEAARDARHRRRSRAAASADRQKLYRFDPKLRLMSTVDAARGRDAHRPRQGRTGGGARALDDDRRPRRTTGRSTRPTAREVLAVLERYASQGLRVLAVARRRLPDGAEPPEPTRGRRARALPARPRRALRPAARRRSPTPSPAASGAGSASSSSPATTGRPRPRSRAGSGSPATAARSSTGEELDALSERELDALLARGRGADLRAHARRRRSCASPTRCARRGTSSR